TDAMHFKRDFEGYDRDASVHGLNIMARILQVEPDELADMIYDVFKRKLYNNLVRILVEDSFPDIRAKGVDDQLMTIIDNSYDLSKHDICNDFFKVGFTTPATLIGVGAPTSLFLPDVGKLMGTKVVSDDYSPVANALGAAVGKVQASVTFEVRYQPETDTYMVFGQGERVIYETLPAAKKTANDFARQFAEDEAIEMGAAKETLEFTQEEKELIVDTEFGSLYMGYRVVVTAQGNLRLN
ncbi:MAG: hypothetical protein J5804_06525, partial [Eggerthellaceae bacterium]|nr:hypothetical protein [Eggerthellaceae bacterium]